MPKQSIQRGKKTIHTLFFLFCFLFPLPSFSDDVSKFFKEREASPCSVSKWSEPVYKNCQRPEPECPKVRNGTQIAYAKTDYKSSHCSFKPINWAKKQCRSRGYPTTESAEMSISDTDYVDFPPRKRCKITFT